jgi:hypothetical protein
VRREPVVAGLGGALFVVLTAWLFSILSGVVLKVRTPEGTLVVEVNEPDPEIFVDGQKVTVTRGENGKIAEITVRPGTHQVEVKKDGFTAYGDRVTLEDQGRKTITAFLTKAQPGPAPVADQPPPTSSVDVRPRPQLARLNGPTAPMPFNNPERDAAEWVLGLNGDLTVVRLNEGPASRLEVKDLQGLPKEAFQIATVNLWGKSEVTDKGLEKIGRLKALQAIGLNGARISDAGLRHLEGLTTLATLDLASTPVTDAGLPHLLALPHLTGLSLGNCNITDAGLPYLGKLKELMSLELCSPGITGDGLRHLKDLTHLRRLLLFCREVNDVGLNHVKSIPRLTELSIAGTAITDLTPLREMALEQLDMRDVPVKSLEPLRGLPLKRIHLDYKPKRDAAVLRSLKSLAEINGKPLEMFWRDVEKSATPGN